VQLDNVMTALKNQFNCTTFEAENFYYNSALKVITEKAIIRNIKDREITKQEFIDYLDKKEALFNEWYHCYRSQQEVFRRLKNEYFTHLNISPFERFFLIEVDDASYLRSDLKDVLYEISRKWSKLSRRARDSFCPYLYFHNLSSVELLNIKNDLYDEGFCFVDGYSYYESIFKVREITKKVDQNNEIRIKIIGELENIDIIMESIHARREVYQFYIGNSFYENSNQSIKHIKIQIKKIKHVKEII